jgi:N-formylglutamate amidohydrolase
MLLSSLLIVILLISSGSPLFAQDQSPKIELLLTVEYGKLPIILSAPHGGRQAIPGLAERRGIGVPQFTTGRDNYTDELTEKISAELEQRLGAKPFSLIARFERKYVDVNRPAHGAYEADDAKLYYDAYHQTLAAMCRRVRGLWGRGLLLDIHGQGADKDMVYRGTRDGKTVSRLIERFGHVAVSGPKSIFGQLAQKGYRVSPPIDAAAREGRYTGGYIVDTYGSQRGTGIDAIQMEFGTSLRNRANLDRLASAVAEGIAVFAAEYLPLSSIRHELQPATP